MGLDVRFWLSRAVILIVAFGLVSSGIGESLAAKPAQSTATCPTGSAQVVLDPGHGGTDPGAINQTYGLVEKEQTLLVAQQAATLLSKSGYSVALTRYDNETSLGNSERGEIANACGAQVFVSIHFNSSTSPDPNYTKTFWGKRRKDEVFSQHMNAALFPALQSYNGTPTNLGNGGTGQFATGSLLQATMPSTLAETVFLSNPEEAGRLADGTGGRQTQIAQSLATGVATWLG